MQQRLLERVLECKLEETRVRRILLQAAGTGDLSTSATVIPAGFTPRWCVKDVEDVSAEGQLLRAIDGEVLEDRRVDPVGIHGLTNRAFLGLHQGNFRGDRDGIRDGARLEADHNIQTLLNVQLQVDRKSVV